MQGVNYDETYCPTTRFTSIRLLLQKAANENMKMHQLDVKGAYPSATINKEIYLQQPEVYEETSNQGKLSWHLNKSIYGLKRSRRNWHQTPTTFPKEQGFTPDAGDPCQYSKQDSADLVQNIQDETE